MPDCGSYDGPAESYRLEVSSGGVVLAAADDAGRARGLATLKQLGPVIAPVVIEDAPRYGWRGVMLDVARHFFGVDDVLRFIDLAALYKVNVLHLHLTDDQGWRLEIAKWPELTVSGAATQVGGGPGGFYTHAEYARIVAHAATHAITVVPEIDVPGHVNAALVAYPELGGGERPEPYTTWSSPGLSLDVGSEIALRFLGDVIAELVASTPGDYIHLGGDEVEGMDHDAYVKFMWDAATVVLRHGRSETTATRDDVDFMVFPRLPAVAEVGWSGRHDWEGFRTRLAAHGPLLEGLGVNFHRSKQVDWKQ